MALANTAEIMAAYDAVLANELDWYVVKRPRPLHWLFYQTLIGFCFIIQTLRYGVVVSCLRTE